MCYTFCSNRSFTLKGVFPISFIKVLFWLLSKDREPVRSRPRGRVTTTRLRLTLRCRQTSPWVDTAPDEVAYAVTGVIDFLSEFYPERVFSNSSIKVLFGLLSKVRGPVRSWPRGLVTTTRLRLTLRSRPTSPWFDTAPAKVAYAVTGMVDFLFKTKCPFIARLLPW